MLYMLTAHELLFPSFTLLFYNSLTHALENNQLPLITKTSYAHESALNCNGYIVSEELTDQ